MFNVKPGDTAVIIAGLNTGRRVVVDNDDPEASIKRKEQWWLCQPLELVIVTIPGGLYEKGDHIISLCLCRDKDLRRIDPLKEDNELTRELETV